MGRILGFFVVSLSLPVAAQVAINYGYATSTPSTVQVVPLLAPPNVALPGSGTAVGAPVAIGVNNARSNDAVGAVYIPGAATDVVVTQPVSIATPVTESLTNVAPAGPATAATATQPPPSTILVETFMSGP